MRPGELTSLPVSQSPCLHSQGQHGTWHQAGLLPEACGQAVLIGALPGHSDYARVTSARQVGKLRHREGKQTAEVTRQAGWTQGQNASVTPDPVFQGLEL